MDSILILTIEHLELSAVGVLLAMAVGIPLGIVITRHRLAAGITMAVTDILQTVPALAMLALLMMVFGLGDTTLVLSLVLYSLLPIVRNTYTGILGIDRGLIEAGRGMGMTKLQLLYLVQLPIALPVILAGIRVALVTAVGIATIGVLIGAGGLGSPIWRGIQQTDAVLILSGAVPAALLAVICDVGLERLERAITPRGLRVKAHR